MGITILARPSHTTLHPSLVLPDGWDAGWKAAKVAGLGRGVLVGDSLMAGQPGGQSSSNTQDWWAQSVYGYLKTLLGVKFAAGIGATFYGYNESLFRNPTYHYGGGATAVAPLFFADGSGGTHNFGWNTNNQGWWHSASPIADTTDWTNATTYMLSFTPIETDAVKVEALTANYSGDVAGSFYYDTTAAGTTKTLVSNPKTAAGGYDVVRTTVWTGAAGQPTIYLGKQAHDHDLILLGFVVYRNLTAGLQIARHAFTGKTMGEFVKQDSSLPTDRVKALVGGWNGTTYNAVGFPTCPHLLVMALGVNDNNKTLGASTGQNADPSVWANAAASICEAGRRARSDMSILFLLPYYPPLLYGDDAGFSFGDSWPAYQDAAQYVARYYNCAYASVNARWGSTSYAQGFTLSNDGHPVAAGYSDMATFLAGDITRWRGRSASPWRVRSSASRCTSIRRAGWASPATGGCTNRPMRSPTAR